MVYSFVHGQHFADWFVILDVVRRYFSASPVSVGVRSGSG